MAELRTVCEDVRTLEPNPL